MVDTNESNHTFELDINHLPFPVIVYEMDGALYYQNQAYLNDEVLNQNLGVPEHIMELLMSIMDHSRLGGFLNLLHGEGFRDTDSFPVTFSSSVMPVSYMCHPYRVNPSGNTRLIGLYFNRLFSDNDRSGYFQILISIAEQIPHPVVITEAIDLDEPGPRMLYVNDRLCQLSGYAREELIGKSPRIFQGPKTSPSAKERLKSALIDRKPILVNLLNYTKDGREYSVELNVFVVENPVTREKFFFGIQENITYKEKQESLIRLAAVGEFSAGIAHEFNNLLSPALGIINDLEGKEDISVAHEGDLQMIKTAITNTTLLTKKLLSLSRGGGELKKEKIVIDELVEENIAFVRNTIDRRIVIRFEPGAKNLLIQANPIEISEVFLNLILNSRDTLMEKLLVQQHDSNVFEPCIVVKTGIWEESLCQETKVFCSVYDNGMGIQKNKRDRLFTPFYTTKGHGKGTGLGLSQSMNIIRALGGDIRLDSEDGQWSQFTVIIPGMNRQERDTEAVNDCGLGSSDKMSAGILGLPRLLYVDDNEGALKIYSRLLKKRGFQISTDSNPRSALEILKEQPSFCDCILVDLNMPLLTGEQFIHLARAVGYRGKFIVLSGYISNEDDMILQETADAILMKPLNLEEFLTVITKLFESQSQKGAPIPNVEKTEITILDQLKKELGSFGGYVNLKDQTDIPE